MDSRPYIKTVRTVLQDILLPAQCLLCQQRAGEGQLCMECVSDMPLNQVCCARCAQPMTRPAVMCGDCLRRPPAFTAAWAPFLYRAPLDLLELRFKFSGRLAEGAALAGLFIDQARVLQRTAFADATPLLACVPLHRSRLRQRGYNQALELARPLARALQLPLAHDLLRRTRVTAPQTGLDARQRRRNLRGAFAVSNAAPLPDHVILIDDVMTTGTTLHECARMLRRAGVERVDAWALARAPAPR